MSFVIEVEAEQLTESQAEAIERTCRQQKAWPIKVHQRGKLGHRLFGRPLKPQLWVPDELEDETPLLTDDAEWLLTDDLERSASPWPMDLALTPRLAQSIHILGEHLPQGFAFRVYWTGSAVRREQEVSIDQLADLARASKLDEVVCYRVPGHG